MHVHMRIHGLRVVVCDLKSLSIKSYFEVYVEYLSPYCTYDKGMYQQVRENDISHWPTVINVHILTMNLIYTLRIFFGNESVSADQAKLLKTSDDISQ